MLFISWLPIWSGSKGDMANGPIRNEIDMNSGMGALGPYNLANAVIGRVWTLMSIIWGYARPRRTFWTSQGNNYTVIVVGGETSPLMPALSSQVK